MTFRRPIKQPFESTMAFSKFFTILPKTGGTLKTFFAIRFFVNMSPLVYFSECSSSAVGSGVDWLDMVIKGEQRLAMQYGNVRRMTVKEHSERVRFDHHLID